MRVYQATTGREISRTTEVLSMIFGGALIVLAILRLSIYPALIGIILILAALLVKRVSVTEDGVLTEYRFLATYKKELWTWDEITDIFCEYSQKQPGKVGIHFTKENMMARRLLFDRKYQDEIIDLALEKNPKIHVEED